MTTKVCKCCGRDLPLEKFYRNTNSSDGRSDICYSCARKKGLANQKSTGKEYGTDERFAQFQSRELIAELRARGYKGVLTIEHSIKL